MSDYGTEAEAQSEQTEGGYYGRSCTKYTDCRYCHKPFPLREISNHARYGHPEESTKYTNCWHCNERFPLNKIRAHARECVRSRIGTDRE